MEVKKGFRIFAHVPVWSIAVQCWVKILRNGKRLKD